MGENKLRCMTWSEQGSSGLLTDAYTSVYVSRQYARTFLSDTRHTSFYVVIRSFIILCEFLFHQHGLIQVLRTFMLPSGVVAGSDETYSDA